MNPESTGLVALQHRGKLAILHERTLKAAQRLTAATPGTETMKRREREYDNADKAFYAALGLTK